MELERLARRHKIKLYELAKIAGIPRSSIYYLNEHPERLRAEQIIALEDATGERNLMNRIRIFMKRRI